MGNPGWTIWPIQRLPRLPTPLVPAPFPPPDPAGIKLCNLTSLLKLIAMAFYVLARNCGSHYIKWTYILFHVFFNWTHFTRHMSHSHESTSWLEKLMCGGQSQSWGFTSRSTARVILGQVLRIATCGTRTHRGDSLWLDAKLANH